MSDPVQIDWSGAGPSSVFVGRESELGVLEQHLLAPEPRLAVVTGDYGSGKTALAMFFARKNYKAFPAGTYHVYATHTEPLAEAIDKQVSHPTAPYLLMLDELETRPTGRQLEEVQEVRRTRPSARVLCLGRMLAWADRADTSIELGGLARSEVDILLRVLVRSQRTGDSKLFESLKGNLLLGREAAELLHSPSLTPRALMLRLRSFAYAGLVGVDGRPLQRGGDAERQIIVDVQAASDDLLKKVHANPTLLYQLEPRQFEEFVAEILDRLGYSVQLTPATKDGGKDIYAAKKDHLGSFLYIVECKKYAPHHRVGVGLIRQLNGVLQAERATAGILATTSFFTRGAKELQTQLEHQITLTDYLGIQAWLDSVFTR